MDSSEVPSKAKLALGAPVPALDVNQCMSPLLPPGARKINCCPPKTNKPIQDFVFPDFPVMRVRRAAHFADKDQAYMKKFNKALQLMKDLPDSDHRSFNNQAAVHCKHCSGDLQVHHSWFFFPFHRWYLYFFERILGKLIDDPNFAMPFWNWDSPDGMQMPSFYTDPNLPFYDCRRDENHQPPTLVDLNFDKKHPSKTYPDPIAQNLHLMYKQMVSGAKVPEVFLGCKQGAGSFENVPHNAVHNWCGDPKQPHMEDMGSFYSAAYDPIFFGFHSNVDRMWSLWKTLGGHDFTDPDWLNHSFEFFDENGDLIRVDVKDCLDTRKLGYVNQDVEIFWRNANPITRVRNVDVTGKGAVTAVEGVPLVYEVFPAKLDKTVKAMVSRPKQSRSKEEKENEEEVLLIDGIEVEANVYVKFDVFINEEDEATSGPDKTEWAGSFVSLRPTQKMKTSLRLGISELLEDLKAEAYVMVTLVPKAGAGDVFIGGAVKIEYLSKQED